MNSTGSKCLDSGDVTGTAPIGQFDKEGLDRVWELCPASGKTFEESLIESGVISSRDLAESYSKQYLLPFFDPPSDQPPPIDHRVAELLPKRICFDAMIAPLADDGVSLDVAIVSPDALKARDEILRLSGRQMRPLFASLEVVESILSLLYGPDLQGEALPNAHEIRDRVDIDVTDGHVAKQSDSVEALAHRRAKEYIIRLFEQALERRATDIYIDPIGQRWRVRMRISGSLVPIDSPEQPLLRSVAIELKSMAKLDTGLDQQPQDGTIKLRHGRRQVPVQLTTCPSVAGETFNLKIRQRNTDAKSLNELGLNATQRTKILQALDGTAGLILVVGPANSGKRTTLYACVQHLNQTSRMLCTVEEAIRNQLPGVNQFSARPEYGLGYQDTVHKVLNRDPDVLMLSDIRDAATLDAVIPAVLDGCHTLAGVNADGAAEAIMKLAALGFSTHELSSVISLVISQRIVRRQCAQCRIEREYSLDDLLNHDVGISNTQWLQSIPELEVSGKLRCFESQGCHQCRGTGFRGGVVLFDEVIPGRLLLNDVISQRASTLPWKLSQTALELVREGTLRLQDILATKTPGDKLATI